MTARQLRAARIAAVPLSVRSTPALHELPAPPAWHDNALCGQVGGDAWFPDDGENAEAIKKICRRCPVRSDCLEDALERHDQFGIWGGYSMRERRAILRKREANAA